MCTRRLRVSVYYERERERHNRVAVRVRVLCERKGEAEKREKCYVDILEDARRFPIRRQRPDEFEAGLQISSLPVEFDRETTMKMCNFRICVFSQPVASTAAKVRFFAAARWRLRVFPRRRHDRKKNTRDRTICASDWKPAVGYLVPLSIDLTERGFSLLFTSRSLNDIVGVN